MKKLDRNKIPSIDQILTYRYLAYGALDEEQQGLIPYGWTDDLKEYEEVDTSIVDLMQHFGVRTLEEFFRKQPFVAGYFFFRGLHLMVWRATAVAREVLLLGEGIPLEVQGMALEALYRMREVSHYLWNHYQMAKEAGHPERVLKWVRKMTQRDSERNPDRQFEKAVFYPDPLMIPLLEETGHKGDGKWRKYIDKLLGEGFEKDEERTLDKAIAPYLFLLEQEGERTDEAEFSGLGDGFLLQFEGYHPEVDWLTDRANALTPSSNVILPKAFDQINPRLSLLIRLFLSGFEPSVRRHLLRQLALSGEKKPESVLQKLVELTDLPGLGQFMANLPESVVPLNYRKALKASLEKVAPSSEAEVRALVRRTYGDEIYEKRFARAVFEPIAGGKAGEVWRVTELGKKPVVLKLIPDSKRRSSARAMSALERWAEQVGFLPDLFRGVSVSENLRQFRGRLEKEMDYTIEAANIKRFKIFSPSPGGRGQGEGVLLPKVLFVSKDILEMEELDLIPIEDLTPQDLGVLDQASGKTIAKALVHHRLMYTDPHAGQLKGSNLGPVLLDFGQVMEVDEKFLQSLYQLIFGVVRQEEKMTEAGLKGLIVFESAKKLEESKFYTAVGTVLKGDALPSAKIEKLLDLAASHGGEVTWELSEFIRMILFWEGAMRENQAPHNNFIGVYLLPELLARFGGF